MNTQPAFLHPDTTPEVKLLDTIQGFDFPEAGHQDITDTLAAQPKTSFFREHLLQPSHYGVIQTRPANPSWLGWVILANLLIVALMRTFYYRKFSLLTLAPFSGRAFNQFLRESVVTGGLFRYYLQFNTHLALGLLIYFLAGILAGVTDFFGSSLMLYLLFVVVAIVFFYYKLIILYVLGRTFRAIEISQQFFQYLYLEYLILGLALLPFLGGAAFSPGKPGEWFAWAGLFLVGILWFLRILMWTASAIRRLFFLPVYIFLYLCTLEILPWLLIVKLIQTI